ncbi:MAG TPA: type IX secretion system sortase PorU, partial [Bacteroidetes bacterium]|nr:type IX secretion system sortase PorU [Bacteroidota bacterium]
MKFITILLALLFTSNIFLAQRDSDSIKFRAPNYVDFSALSDGDIYKIPISKTGVFKLSYDYLKNLGIDIDNLDAENIKIYGNGGGILKQKIDDDYIDDLKEVPIFIKGDEDNKINSGDYILFYAEGPDKWYFDSNSKIWKFEKNIYSINNYYFLKVSATKGKRIESKSIQGTPQYVSDETDIYSVYEEDMTNLLGNYIKTEGSGQEWYGDFFSSGKEADFSSKFTGFSFIKEKGLTINIKAAARDGFNRMFTANLNDTTIQKSISKVFINDPESTYARKVNIFETIYPSGSTPKIKLKYDGQNAWLDKIELNARTKINFTGNSLLISDKNAPFNTIAGFELNNVDANTMVWDITDPNNTTNMSLSTTGNKGTFTYNHTVGNRFIVLSINGNFQEPESGQKIENQNLHGISDADMLIVYPEEFEEAALELKEHRMQNSNLNVYAVRLDKIFNEFGCGKYDPTAIRDFARMLMVRNDNFKYLLLFGDGSYDARGISIKTDNYIPVYETKNSLDPINSFPSDDYFGLLSYGEGENLSGKVDIGVGRIPVNSSEQANNYVQKIKNYETNRDYFGSWRNKIAIAADDVDESWDITHFLGAEKISSNILSKYPVINIDKIYLDAFIQENNAGGQRYPDVNQAINASIYNGDLMFVYVGHGGPKGLAQERILQKDDIKTWNNKTKLPLLITATCSFTGFDDPAVLTAGEEAFLKQKGGVIGLFSTVRAVYASSNDALMKSTFNAFFGNESNKLLPLGDIIKIAKNNTSDTNNKRKFLLFG